MRSAAVFRKIVSPLIVVPLAVVIIAFAVANRQSVTVSFDPFSSTSPAYAATLPLFVLIFILLILGVLDRRHCRLAGAEQMAAHRAQARSRRARACIRNWMRSAGALLAEPPPAAPEPAPYTVIPPPIP